MKPTKRRAALILSLLMSVCFHAAALTPNGTAVYSELGSQLYLGTLFLDTPNQAPGEILESSQAKRMELRFTDNMSKRRWAQNWTQSMAINSARDAMISAADDLSETLNAFKSGLKYGDTVVIEYDPLYGTSVSVNDVTLVQERSATLFNLFLASWIGPVPPSREFKEAILGQTPSDNEYTTFLSISPSEERVAAVEAWDTELSQAREAAQAAEEEARRQAEEEARKKAEEEARQQAEAEAMAKAEEEARKKAEAERLAEEKQEQLIEEEKRKAQEAARKKAEEEAAQREAERLAQEQARQEKLAAEQAQQEAEAEDEEDMDVSVAAILAQQDYTTEIIRKIYSSVRYPKSAIRNSQEGSVRALVSIDRQGNLLEIVISEKSEYESLNEAAEDAIRDAAPFPAIPGTLTETQLDLTVPIAFRLN